MTREGLHSGLEGEDEREGVGGRGTFAGVAPTDDRFRGALGGAGGSDGRAYLAASSGRARNVLG